VLRSAFEALVSVGAVSRNPTLELQVRHESRSRVPTPLIPSEAARLVVASQVTPCAAPWPATCVLALLGAAHAEIAAVGPAFGRSLCGSTAANAVYATTQRIEAVAQQLGLSSYDTAAHLIDREWQQRWGDAVRAETGDDG